MFRRPALKYRRARREVLQLANAVSDHYLAILVLGLVAFLLVFVTLLLSKLLAPSNPTPRKLTTYESGEITQGLGRGPIEIQYYLYILVFLVLDIEVIFLLPFAVQFGEIAASGGMAILEMLLFVGLLFLGWLYAWKKGALEWVR